ncbi:MAG: recombination-associated protein RdgC [Gammaproteobacteria bacterium]|nr:recombination-associated protein RdgC [Gammaproteobacteria bacterium]
MWFKNLQIHQLLAPLGLSPEELHQRLEQAAFRPCGSLEPETLGWDRPLGRDGDLLTHAASGCIMLCATRQERLLPSSVVREELDERVAALEDKEGRKIGRKQKLQMRDELIVDLMPKAFVRSSRTYAYIDEANGWIIVDSASTKRAEELLSLLRETLGSLKTRPLAVRDAPASVFTHWVSSEAPADFLMQEECELREPSEEGGIIRCRRQALDSDEIASHLAAGKQVVRLAVEWQERLGCVLADDLLVRRLKFLDLVQDQVSDANPEDAIARFDVDFAIMVGELRQFIPRLLEIFGGLAEEA